MGDLSDFVKWLDSLKDMSAPVPLNWDDYVTQMRHIKPPTPDEISRQQFLDQLRKVQDDKEKRNLRIPEWEGAFELSGSKPAISFYYGLEFVSAPSLRLSHLGFKNISIIVAPSVELTDVWVDTLRLDRCGDVSLLNCFIGTLIVNFESASTLDVRGGGVLDITCPAPSSKGPFTGSVYFDKKVYFSRAPGLRLKGPQPYRNMRAHMLKLENTPMVSLFHTLEQATERKMEKFGFHRAISALYEYLSDYGSSALRPFVLFIALFGITFLFVLVFDGAVHADTADLAGWQKTLTGDDWLARARRAFVLAGQATLNPLGVFGTKGLLVAKTGLLALWLSVHGLLSTIFIALFVFAIRRRFKMG